MMMDAAPEVLEEQPVEDLDNLEGLDLEAGEEAELHALSSLVVPASQTSSARVAKDVAEWQVQSSG